MGDPVGLRIWDDNEEGFFARGEALRPFFEAGFWAHRRPSDPPALEQQIHASVSECSLTRNFPVFLDEICKIAAFEIAGDCSAARAPKRVAAKLVLGSGVCR